MNQPNDTSLAAKIKHCQTHNCPYLNKGGRCGFKRLIDGPHKGQFPSLTEIETCPANWAEKVKELTA